MSAERVYAIRCDNLHCDATLIDIRATSKWSAAHIAALHGWHTTRRVDFCPEHLPGADLAVLEESLASALDGVR